MTVLQEKPFLELVIAYTSWRGNPGLLRVVSSTSRLNWELQTRKVVAINYQVHVVGMV